MSPGTERWPTRDRVRWFDAFVLSSRHEGNADHPSKRWTPESQSLPRAWEESLDVISGPRDSRSVRAARRVARALEEIQRIQSLRRKDRCGARKADLRIRCLRMAWCVDAGYRAAHNLPQPSSEWTRFDREHIPAFRSIGRRRMVRLASEIARNAAEFLKFHRRPELRFSRELCARSRWPSRSKSRRLDAPRLDRLWTLFSCGGPDDSSDPGRAPKRISATQRGLFSPLLQGFTRAGFGLRIGPDRSGFRGFQGESVNRE